MFGFNIKKRLAVFLVIFLFFGIAIAEGWQVLKGEHFLVYYMEDKNFAKEILWQAERYYDKIASDLGYSRYGKFWLWENRVKITIYSTHEEFIRATGISRKWADGVALYKEKEIITHKQSKEFLNSLLPHELTHLIFRDFVGFPDPDMDIHLSGGQGFASSARQGQSRAWAAGKGIPLWLDEGVAQWEEKNKRKEAIEIAKGLIKKNSYIPIGRLMQMDVRQEEDYELARNFYVQAVALVGVLIEGYGGLKFNLFCRQLRDGKNMNEALSFVYGNSISNVDELERKWVKRYGGE